MVKFLTDIGLPPQTLGAQAHKSGEPLRTLTEDEKNRCQGVLAEIGRCLPKGKGKGGVDWFNKDKNGQVKAEDFLKVLEGQRDKSI